METRLISRFKEFPVYTSLCQKRTFLKYDRVALAWYIFCLLNGKENILMITGIINYIYDAIPYGLLNWEYSSMDHTLKNLKTGETYQIPGTSELMGVYRKSECPTPRVITPDEMSYWTTAS